MATTSNLTFITEVLRLTNEFRAQNGLALLTANLELNAAAQGHSEDMADQDYFDHVGKNGSSFSDRAKLIGYEPATGENIAAGNPTPESVVQTWIDSPGHRANILNPSSTELGVGYAYLENDTGSTNYGHYWTQVFGTGDTNPATNLPEPPVVEPPVVELPPVVEPPVIELPPVVNPPVVEPPVVELPPVVNPPVVNPPAVEPPVIELPPVVNPPVVELPPVEQPAFATEGDDVLLSSSDQGISVSGLAGNDRVTGGLGNDTLDGGAGDDTIGGGAGKNVMSGGLGNDSYTIDSSVDIITEAINEGNDTVLASTSYTLSDNVENLTLISTNVVDGTGNSLNNIMTGNAANNYLYGGDGNDQVNGQAGDDYLYGQAGDDLLNSGEGIDWLVGDLGDDILSGGASNDRLFGGLGNDTLMGDKGRDRLTGGADADRFVLSPLDKNFDTITDFQSKHGDKIAVSTKGLGGRLKQGNLSSTRFTLGSASEHTKSDFIYDKSSGRLFFDVDGMGGQKQVQLAQLTAGTALASGNILVMA
ncbi:MAG: hypothetical protein HY785_05260 [Oscillatoriophycideae cyanobacterium NC_groundwater_1537_Pr4_S-0.65um_50_18]|nr:hypothetical protein [Oscillatoriophycideae cyanobacterium NC_groundwater_1537_Pr4_S-0.65um_50_18]